MFSVPAEYDTLLMKPTVDRFLKDPTAYDLCFNACIYLFHFCDVLAQFEGGKTEDVRQRIEKEDCLINVVHAVCTAAKHVVVQNQKLKYVGFRSEDAHVSRGAAFSDGSYYSDGSSHSDAPNVVRVTMPDSQNFDMSHVVKSVYTTITTKFIPRD